MKSAFNLLAFCFMVTAGHAQPKIMQVTHYLFPEFTKGIVLMKTGVRNEALLNYNSLTEEMIFDNRGSKLALDQLEAVDTVYINDKKFCPMGNKFVEMLYHSKYDLFVEHKCELKDPGKPAGYGGISQTSAISTYSTYFSGNRVYDLKLPEGIETKPFIEYWLRKNGKLTKFVSIRQLIKLFGEKKKIIKLYVKENAVDYDNQESVVGLMRFLEGN